MRFRLGIVLGAAAGYYLGAQAGRERYEQINRLVNRAGGSNAKSPSTASSFSPADLPDAPGAESAWTVSDKAAPPTGTSGAGIDLVSEATPDQLIESSGQNDTLPPHQPEFTRLND